MCNVVEQYVDLQRWFGYNFYGMIGAGSVLMKIESDGPPRTPSPYIIAAKVGK